MIRIIKLGNLIYENIEPFHIDENGNKIWNIPNDYDSLKAAIEDTLGWLVFNNIQKSINRSPDKLNASNSKAICLLAKVINTLNPDLTHLTEKEQTAFNKMLSLANDGYTDSDLLNFTSDQLQSQLNWYANKIQELNNLTTVDELINFLENLKV